MFASAAAQTKTNPGPPAALVVAILCYALRKQPIGGWLLYYYISLYASLAVSLLLLATTLQNYSPARWQSTELYALAITTTALGQLPLLAQAVVATIFLKRREWEWLKLLRAILIAGVICIGLSIVLDSVFFRGDQTVLDWFALVWTVIWLAYFFVSKRVKRVFLSKDWVERAPVSAGTPPPVQTPSPTPDTAGPSFAASEPDQVLPQKTKTPALIFTLCALAFCGVVILFFRPGEKHQTLRPVVPEIRKAIPVRNEPTVDFSALPDLPDRLPPPSHTRARVRVNTSRDEKDLKTAFPQEGVVPHCPCFRFGAFHFPVVAEDSETLQLFRRWPERDLCRLS